ncbi:unnamed protein product, partial [Didymodactylos carnosus]
GDGEFEALDAELTIHHPTDEQVSPRSALVDHGDFSSGGTIFIQELRETDSDTQLTAGEQESVNSHTNEISEIPVSSTEDLQCEESLRTSQLQISNEILPMIHANPSIEETQPQVIEIISTQEYVLEVPPLVYIAPEEFLMVDNFALQIPSHNESRERSLSVNIDYSTYTRVAISQEEPDELTTPSDIEPPLSEIKLRQPINEVIDRNTILQDQIDAGKQGDQLLTGNEQRNDNVGIFRKRSYSDSGIPPVTNNIKRNRRTVG